MYAPQVIVSDFSASRDLEGSDVSSLRIERGEYLPNETVFPGGIDSL